MTAGVVASTFVRDATSKIVLRVIVSSVGTNARFPYAFQYTLVPCWTQTTAPGRRSSPMAVLMAESICESLWRGPMFLGCQQSTGRESEDQRQQNRLHPPRRYRSF